MSSQVPSQVFLPNNSFLSMPAICITHLIFLVLTSITMFGEGIKLWSSRQPPLRARYFPNLSFLRHPQYVFPHCDRPIILDQTS